MGWEGFPGHSTVPASQCIPSINHSIYRLHWHCSEDVDRLFKQHTLCIYRPIDRCTENTQHLDICPIKMDTFGHWEREKENEEFVGCSERWGVQRSARCKQFDKVAAEDNSNNNGINELLHWRDSQLDKLLPIGALCVQQQQQRTMRNAKTCQQPPPLSFLFLHYQSLSRSVLNR